MSGRGRPARWLVLSVPIPPDDTRRDLIADALLSLGGSSVVEEDGALVTYLPAPEGDVARFVAAAAEWIGTDPTWWWQPEEDWAREWKRGLQPREITPRIVVKPTWTSYPAAPGQVVIDIDPQMAFGTGEHATTRGVLRLLDGAIRAGDRVLDVGSGSAILSVAAARLGAGEVVAVEYDPDANLNARENLERNAVQVRLIEAMADPALIAGLGGFDLILANILSGVIMPMLPAFRAALRPGGRLIVSGILQAEAAEVVAAAQRAGLQVQEEDREEEWWSALLVANPSESH